jgi:hypothetical protein
MPITRTCSADVTVMSECSSPLVFNLQGSSRTSTLAQQMDSAEHHCLRMFTSSHCRASTKNQSSLYTAQMNCCNILLIHCTQLWGSIQSGVHVPSVLLQSTKCFAPASPRHSEQRRLHPSTTRESNQATASNIQLQSGVPQIQLSNV